jgi:LTXXQ motif family protein
LGVVHEPLAAFFASLSDEQKQRFENLGSSKGRAPAGGDVAALCSQQSGAATNLPIQRIEQVVQLNDQQQQDAFAALKQASRDTAAQLQASCPSQVPQAPVERLDAVKTRLQAMVDAMNTVRPKLQAFYSSLSDDQKARFNTMAPPQNASAATQGTNR